MMKKLFCFLFIVGLAIMSQSQAWAVKRVRSDLFVRFEAHLDQLAGRFSEYLDSASSQDLPPIIERELKELASLNEEILLAFDIIGRELKGISSKKTVQTALRGRHGDFVDHYRKEYSELTSRLAALSTLSHSSAPQEIKKELSSFISLVERGAILRRQPLDPGNLPIGIAKFNDLQPTGDGERLFLPAPGARDPDDPSYLSETPAVMFTEKLEELADSLKENPVRMTQWVKDHIDFVPLYGSMKGSELCLIDRSGNDCDQASLLIALLRYADIPARYVYGKVQVKEDDLISWLGTGNIKTAWETLKSHGIPLKDGVFDHVWVEAYLDDPSQWGIEGPPRWMALDPSFKRYRSSKVTSKNTLLEELSESLYDPFILQEANIDVKRGYRLARSIIHEPVNAALPYRVEKRLWAGAAMGRDFTFRVRTTLLDPQGDILFSKEFPLNEFARQSVSLVYLPAGFQDSAIMKSLQALTENPDSDISSTPAYLIRMRPHLLMGNRIVLSGGAGNLGEKQTLKLTLSAPRFGKKTFRHTVLAGSQSALRVMAGGVSRFSTYPDSSDGYSLKEKLFKEPLKYLEDKLGTAFLNRIVLDYQWKNSQLRRLIASRTGMVINSFFSEGIASRGVKTGYLFGRPVFFEYSGVQLDIQADLVCAAFGNEDFGGNRLLAAVGSYGSMLEHYVLELASDKPTTAVSAVKVLSKARETGIVVRKIQPGEEKELARLSLPQALKSDILGALQRQQEVYIPERSVKIDGWEGYGYILVDRATGSQGYMISGLGAGITSPLSQVRRRPYDGYGGGTSTNVGATSNITMPKGTIARFIIVILVLGAIIVIVMLVA